jgi:hypothetical protein
LTAPEPGPDPAVTQVDGLPARQLTRQVTAEVTAAAPAWRWVILAAGLCVGLAGAALTATGLYAVAVGSGVPAGLAWLYVAATDGLALVAYGTTSIVQRRADRLYAWLVVLVAAGLSGLAQATHLGQGAGADATVTAGWLRFGVGYWPAVSTAICAHLLWLVSRSGWADQPVVSASAEPEDRATEPATELARLAHLELVSRPAEPQVSHPSRAEPARPTEPGSASGSLRACDCGLDYCPGLVPRSTRTAHLRRAANRG